MLLLRTDKLADGDEWLYELFLPIGALLARAFELTGMLYVVQSDLARFRVLDGGLFRLGSALR
jgi:hypothetical protein